jgi:hypothetical protein
MNEGILTMGETSTPRFEFRSFGQHFEQAAHRMSRLSMPLPEHLWDRSSDEIYLISRTQDSNNIKIRDGKLDVKSHVQTLEGLEQWKPLLKTEFPVTSGWLKNELIPILYVNTSALIHDTYNYPDFLEWADQQPELQAVRIHKRRFAYLVHNTICETGEVLINGAQVQTISCEAEESGEVLQTLKALGLTGVENINYLQAIKRVMGMIHKPLAN